jgi:hypothetical protein
MSDDDLQALVAANYVALADLLETLPAERWETSSMCEGWRVREVVAHLTMPARYSEDEFMAELRDDSFDFTRLSNRIASRDAQLPTGDLVWNLRDEGLHRWTPPGGGYRGALNHVVIHSLDITVPLGEPRCASDTAIRSVLDDLTEGGGHANFGTDIRGRSLYRGRRRLVLRLGPNFAVTPRISRCTSAAARSRAVGSRARRSRTLARSLATAGSTDNQPYPERLGARECRSGARHHTHTERRASGSRSQGRTAPGRAFDLGLENGMECRRERLCGPDSG